MQTTEKNLAIEKKLSELLLNNNPELALRSLEGLDLKSINTAKGQLICAAIYRELDDFEQAAHFSYLATQLEPENKAAAIINSTDYLKTGDLEKAEHSLNKLNAAQQNDADVLYHRSKVLYQKKEYASASKLLVKVVQKYPKFAAAHLELAHALLMQGKWKAGWAEYEWRYQLTNTKDMFPKFKMPHWNGRPVPHILLIADQGYGDCFQFTRYLPLVAQRCERITLMRSEPLARLYETNPYITEGFSKWEETPLTSAYCTLSSLPRIFETRPGNIPSCSNIINSIPEDLARWSKRLKSKSNHIKLKVGLAWSGRVDFQENYLRAMRFENFETLLHLPDIKFYSIQVGTPAAEAETKNITDLSKELTDFSETAAAMQALDLIITTDTSVAHLAGSLGRPTWVLLAYSPDWRWGAEGDKSAWYPSIKLFRQKQNKDWESVIKECKKSLEELISSDNPKAI